jgi:hypothetical protein
MKAYTAAKFAEVFATTGALIIQVVKLSNADVPPNSTTLPKLVPVELMVKFLKYMYLVLSSFKV